MRKLKLILSILLPLSIGGVAGYLTAEAIPGWYVTLNRPFFNPPNWLFGPVWTLLYILMGIGCFRIWSLPASPVRNRALCVYTMQLALNFAWSFIFFNNHAMGFALLEIVLLWINIVWMIRLFRVLDRTAAFLQIPYLLWVSFATLLNASYWWLN